jgi:Ca-activated chloride channel family protein
MSRLPHGLRAEPPRGRLRRNPVSIFAFIAILSAALFDVGDITVDRISAEQVRQQQATEAGTTGASKSENVPTSLSTPPGGTAAKPKGSGGESQSANEPRTGEQSNITVRVQVVNVPVSVLDRRGHLVIDLAQRDFELYEDGKPQSIKYFFRGSRPPLRIGLIVDTSNSARRKLQFEQDAASEFVFEMLQGRTSKNQIFLQTFDATSSVLQDLTNDPEKLNDKIRDLKAGGGKALYDAIYSACKEKMLKTGAPQDSRRVLVVVSDGVDVQSKRSLDEVISMAHTAETAIYTLSNSAWGYANPGDKLLRVMAEQTGGAAYFPQAKTPGVDLGTGYLSHGQIGDGETSQNKGLGAATGTYSAQRLVQLADALEAIGKELAEQYSIGYTPTNPTLDGTYRTIKVVALRKGVVVRSKPGYFALAQPQ